VNILHINTFDYGGAAQAALRLHHGLLSIGEHSQFLTLGEQNPDIPHHVNFELPEIRRWQWWLRRAGILTAQRHRNEKTLACLGTTLEPFGLTLSDAQELVKHPAVQEADVINLHWVAQLLDWPSFFSQISKPIVWTLHDMYPFTGGCHYDRECGRYENLCGNCPIIGSEDSDDLSRNQRLAKGMALKSLKQEQLTIVAPSRWLADCARKSSLFSRFQTHHIPYGIDLDAFSPDHRTDLHEELGIAPEHTLLLFVADYATPRKGLHLLEEAISLLQDKQLPLTLVSVGAAELRQNSSFNHIKLGHIKDPRRMARIFASADLFACPSLQDNLPNTVLEALASGTPTIAFNTGGLPDMVREGSTGFLAEELTAQSFADALERAIRSSRNQQPDRRDIRQQACSNYPLSLQGQRYQSLYNDLLQLP